MADAYTDFLNLTKPEVGGSRDAWGNKWNANADAISVWAKATDALVKRAILKDAKDTNGAAVGQSIAGPLSLGAGYGFTSGGHVVVPAGYRFIAGTGSHFFESRNADGTMYATDVRTGSTNVFRVLNAAENAEMLRLDLSAGVLNVFGKTVWHNGNFTPGNYAIKTVDAVQTFAGPIEISRPTPYLDLTYGNVIRSRQIIDGTGTWVLRDGDNGDNKFYVTKDGLVWTKQFGDLNSRIEARAAAFADDRLNTARSEYGQAYQKTGGSISGDVTISKTTPSLWLQYPGVKLGRWVIDGGGSLLWQDQSGQNHFYITSAGGVWTQQFGDLNSRIEARAQSFADDRLSTARAEYGQKVAKSGDTMTGALTFSYTTSAPAWVDHVIGGVFRWRNQLHGDGQFVWKNGDNGDIKMALNTGGGLYLAQLGRSVGEQIELRGAAYADDRLNTATARINNKSARLSFVQDTVIGDVGNSATWEGVSGGVITGFQQNGTTGQARAFRVRQLQMSDSNGSWYACGYV